MLPVAEKVTRSPELQILLGNAEAVPRFAQSLQPGLGVRIAVVGQEDAVALGRSPAHPAPQLVKLAETKAVRILHHHHRSVGHIHSHFNDGGCHQDLRLSPGKLRHGCLFFRSLHSPVKEAYLQIRKYPLP